MLPNRRQFPACSPGSSTLQSSSFYFEIRTTNSVLLWRPSFTNRQKKKKRWASGSEVTQSHKLLQVLSSYILHHKTSTVDTSDMLSPDERMLAGEPR